MTATKAAGEFERVAQYSIGAVSSEYRLLHDHFVFGSGVNSAADLGIFAFGIFAHNPEVNVSRFLAAQWTWNARQQANRPQVDVLIKLPADGNQQAPQRDVVRHAGKPDSAEENGVVVA